LVRFEGECDTAIIKGVLALLIELASGRTEQEIQRLDVDEIFRRLALDEHLSPNRHVGVYAIVDLMKQQAQECAPLPLAVHA
jgi:cysteine desulfuration protein SufE